MSQNHYCKIYFSFWESHNLIIDRITQTNKTVRGNYAMFGQLLIFPISKENECCLRLCLWTLWRKTKAIAKTFLFQQSICLYADKFLTSLKRYFLTFNGETFVIRLWFVSILLAERTVNYHYNIFYVCYKINFSYLVRKVYL